MRRPYRPRRRRPRRIPDHCQACGEKLPPDKLYFYVDENNEAITYNSPALCLTCYRARYSTPY